MGRNVFIVGGDLGVGWLFDDGEFMLCGSGVGIKLFGNFVGCVVLLWWFVNGWLGCVCECGWWCEGNWN